MKLKWWSIGRFSGLHTTYETFFKNRILLYSWLPTYHKNLAIRKKYGSKSGKFGSFFSMKYPLHRSKSYFSGQILTNFSINKNTACITLMSTYSKHHLDFTYKQMKTVKFWTTHVSWNEVLSIFKWNTVEVPTPKCHSWIMLEFVIFFVEWMKWGTSRYWSFPFYQLLSTIWLLFSMSLGEYSK